MDHHPSGKSSEISACHLTSVKMRVLVTVGTTKFPELVASSLHLDVASLLASMGYNHMEIQVG